MRLLALCLSAYLLGSIPFGILIGKWKKINLREQGSGNIGAANAFRTLGILAGLLVLLGDAAKGWIPLMVAKRVLPNAFPLDFTAVGISAILGHTYSCFLKCRGGKGIATTLGVFLFLNWKATLSAFGFWVLIVAATKISSLGSIVATLFLPIFLVLFKESKVYVIFGIAVFLLALYKHRVNIRRLFAGEENRLL